MPDSIRDMIQQRLTSKGLSATPQALNALVAAVTHSSIEVAGDSDSLLLGLLSCGSYTLDLLRDSGADVEQLLDEAADTAAGYPAAFASDNGDAMRSLFAEAGNFGRLIERPELKHRPIEAADLLQEAVSPLQDDRWSRKQTVTSIRQPSNQDTLRVDNELRLVVDEALFEVSRYIWQNPQATLLERRIPLTAEELTRLSGALGGDPRTASTAATALNRYIASRTLPTDDSEFISLAVRLTELPSIGSSHFVFGGGRYHDLSLSLRTSRRFAPERDEPSLTMLEEDGKIVIEHFSYRGTAAISGSKEREILSVNSRLALPLVHAQILREFEALLNASSTNELHIQRFLERYPEVLKSLGYVDCKPQIILREAGKRDLKPDFLLFKPGNNGFDILDLKLPSASIVRTEPYPRISHEITKAIAQLRAYRNYFSNAANRDRFVHSHGIEFFEPSLIVTIGRQHQYPSAAIRNELQQQSRDVRLMTYDELVAYAKVRTLCAT